MPGVLLDTHALYWLVSGEASLSDDALVAIGESQAENTLFVSPVTAWELALAARKPAHCGPPHLGIRTPKQWFREAVRAIEAKVIPIRQTIAIEAANVVAETGHGDPGDCFLIATARARHIAMVTRDAKILKMARERYLTVIQC